MSVGGNGLRHNRTTPGEAVKVMARRDQDLVDDFEKAKGTK
jgi:hypothetical protein